MMMDGTPMVFGSADAVRFDAGWPAMRQREAILMMLECGLDRGTVAVRCGVSRDVLDELLSMPGHPIPAQAQSDWHPDDQPEVTMRERLCLELNARRSADQEPVESVRQAAALLDLPAGSVTRLLSQLSRAGLVQRSGFHTMAGSYTLTDAGWRVLVEGAA